MSRERTKKAALVFVGFVIGAATAYGAIRTLPYLEPRPVHVSGTVLNTKGEPVNGIDMFVRYRDGQSVKAGVTGDGGLYALSVERSQLPVQVYPQRVPRRFPRLLVSKGTEAAEYTFVELRQESAGE